MIRITVELIPFGIKGLKRNIGEIVIINSIDHPKRPEYGNYEVTIKDIGKDIIKELTITNHKRKEGVWVLLKKILENI